jgi:hypothetical protein
MTSLRQAGRTYTPTMPRKDTDPKGPRGGETTVTKSGMIRKTIWLHGDEAEALRDRAYRNRRTESELVREALRAYLGIED